MSNPKPLNKKTVDAYVDALKESPLPAVLVDDDGHLIYGMHRLNAVKRDQP